MPRKLTARERWLLAMMPALLIVCIYAFGAYGPMKNRLTDAAHRTESARNAGVTQQHVMARQRMLIGLQRRAESMKLAAVSGGMPDLISPEQLSLLDETAAMSLLNRVFGRRDVFILASSRTGENTGSSMMATDVAESLKHVADPTGGAGHGVWKLELVGSFTGLSGALADIRDLSGMVLPLGVTMEPADAGGNDHYWMLWVWI